MLLIGPGAIQSLSCRFALHLRSLGSPTQQIILMVAAIDCCCSIIGFSTVGERRRFMGLIDEASFCAFNDDFPTASSQLIESSSLRSVPCTWLSATVKRDDALKEREVSQHRNRDL